MDLGAARGAGRCAGRWALRAGRTSSVCSKWSVLVPWVAYEVLAACILAPMSAGAAQMGRERRGFEPNDGSGRDRLRYCLPARRSMLPAVAAAASRALAPSAGASLGSLSRLTSTAAPDPVWRTTTLTGVGSKVGRARWGPGGAEKVGNARRPPRRPRCRAERARHQDRARRQRFGAEGPLRDLAEDLLPGPLQPEGGGPREPGIVS